MMDYDTLIKNMKPGKTITFREYTLDRHERKHESVFIENGIIRDCFPGGEVINLDRMKEIWGEDLEIDDYRALSICMSPRFLVSVGTDEDGNDMVKMLTINQYFYETGQQEVTIKGMETDVVTPHKVRKVNEEPNYLEAMRAFNDMF